MPCNHSISARDRSIDNIGKSKHRGSVHPFAGTGCLEFRPSEIAATVAAAVAGEDHHAVDICCNHVDKVSRARRSRSFP
jgi:hypothetical protein